MAKAPYCINAFLYATFLNGNPVVKAKPCILSFTSFEDPTSTHHLAGVSVMQQNTLSNKNTPSWLMTHTSHLECEAQSGHPVFVVCKGVVHVRLE